MPELAGAASFGKEAISEAPEESTAPEPESDPDLLESTVVSAGLQMVPQADGTHLLTEPVVTETVNGVVQSIPTVNATASHGGATDVYGFGCHLSGSTAKATTFPPVYLELGGAATVTTYAYHRFVVKAARNLSGVITQQDLLCSTGGSQPVESNDGVDYYLRRTGTSMSIQHQRQVWLSRDWVSGEDLSSPTVELSFQLGSALTVKKAISTSGSGYHVGGIGKRSWAEFSNQAQQGSNQSWAVWERKCPDIGFCRGVKSWRATGLQTLWEYPSTDLQRVLYIDAFREDAVYAKSFEFELAPGEGVIYY